MNIHKNKSTTKSNATQVKSSSLETKQMTQPSPQRENEIFESIDEAELPTIGDISSSNTTQPSTTVLEVNQLPDNINKIRDNSSQ